LESNLNDPSFKHSDWKTDPQVKVLLFLSRGALTRIKILTILDKNLQTCSQIAKKLKVDWSTVKKHLEKLEKVELVKVYAKLGNAEFYGLTLKAINSILKSHFSNANPLKALNCDNP
jgi:DNA-binding transcriptional ArsR family regulator